MASARMFNKTLVTSSRFTRMSPMAQLLYFHMGMIADDDGVADAWNAMNAIKATEQDLEELEKKGFVEILNEDMVSYIKDWNVNNHIRKDRKMDGLYGDLLKSKGIDITEKVERADVKKKKEEKKPVKVKEEVNVCELMQGSSAEMVCKVEEWLKYKQEKRQKYQPTGLKNLISQIKNNIDIYGEKKVINLISECMSSGWQGIIWDKLKTSEKKGEAIDSWMQRNSEL